MSVHEVDIKQSGYKECGRGSSKARAQGRDLVNMVLNNRPLTSASINLSRRTLLHKCTGS
jgi:hypothetical protein